MLKKIGRLICQWTQIVCQSLWAWTKVAVRSLWSWLTPHIIDLRNRLQECARRKWDELKTRVYAWCKANRKAIYAVSAGIVAISTLIAWEYRAEQQRIHMAEKEAERKSEQKAARYDANKSRFENMSLEGQLLTCLSIWEKRQSGDSYINRAGCRAMLLRYSEEDGIDKELSSFEDQEAVTRIRGIWTKHAIYTRYNTTGFETAWSGRKAEDLASTCLDGLYGSKDLLPVPVSMVRDCKTYLLELSHRRNDNFDGFRIDEPKMNQFLESVNDQEERCRRKYVESECRLFQKRKQLKGVKSACREVVGPVPEVFLDAVCPPAYGVATDDDGKGLTVLIMFTDLAAAAAMRSDSLTTRRWIQSTYEAWSALHDKKFAIMYINYHNDQIAIVQRSLWSGKIDIDYE